MSLVAIKLLASIAILFVGLIGGLIPLLASQGHAGRRFFSLGNALAGGIFLGVGFMHLLPEADEMLSEIVHYPLASLVTAVGVVMLLCIDRVVFEVSKSSLGMQATQQDRRQGSIYPFVLLIALSAHSVIAGIALGLEPEIAASLFVMLGILLHKGSAAFALIVSAHSAGMDRQGLRRILAIFVLMTPLGILFGSVAAGLLEGKVASLGEGVFNALAAGTFIYIAILGVLGEELSRRQEQVARFVASTMMGQGDVDMPIEDRDRVLKFLLVVVGLAAMASLELWH